MKSWMAKLVACLAASLAVFLAATIIASAGAPVTLKVMRPGYPKEARAFFTEVQAALAKEYPNIQLEIVDADWNTFHSRMPIWVTGKQDPDIYLCSLTDLAGIVDVGGVMPVDKIIDAQLREDIPAGAWDAVKYKGKIVAIPGDYAPFVLWYNKDIFKKAGLNPTKPPATWDELVQYALKIKQETGVAPFGVNLGRSADITELSWGMFFVSATNHQYIDDNDRPRITSPESVKAHTFLADLIRKHKVTQPDPQLYSKGDLRVLMRDEKIAMDVDGPWLMNVLASKIDLSSAEASKYAIAPAPRPSVEGKTAMYASTTDSWVISSHTKYPEEAQTVLKFLLRPEWQYAHDRHVQQMPFRKSLYRDSAKYPMTNNWVYRAMNAVIEKTINAHPITPTSNADYDALKNAVIKMSTGAASVEDALNEASAIMKQAKGVQ